MGADRLPGLGVEATQVLVAKGDVGNRLPASSAYEHRAHGPLHGIDRIALDRGSLPDWQVLGQRFVPDDARDLLDDVGGQRNVTAPGRNDQAESWRVSFAVQHR